MAQTRCPSDPKEALDVFLTSYHQMNLSVLDYDGKATFESIDTNGAAVTKLVVTSTRKVSDGNVSYSNVVIRPFNDGTPAGDKSVREGLRNALIGRIILDDVDSSKMANRPNGELNRDNYDYAYVDTEKNGDMTLLKYELKPRRTTDMHLMAGGSYILVDAATCMLIAVRGNNVLAGMAKSVLERPVTVDTEFQYFLYKGQLVTQPVIVSLGLPFKKSGFMVSLARTFAGNLHDAQAQLIFEYTEGLEPVSPADLAAHATSVTASSTQPN